ncbi:PhoD-like phosphatase-domain-containing protein [Limtongia smithiae]|uniref:PhoD-like phosphatase-domain-containing protein n=1 Tax=Limtongia smithiae TaxID=1125753 RepID=UPI0034CDBC26
MAAATVIIGSICAASSSLLRVVGYFFLRWAPLSIFPPAIYTAFAVYFASFFYLFDAQIKTENTAEATGKEAPATKTEAETNTEKSHEGAPPVDGKSDTTVSRVPWRTFFLGLPEIDRPFWTLLAIFINLSVLCCTLDLVYTSFKSMPLLGLEFSRIGYVSSTSATFVVRDPFSEPVLLRYREIVSGAEEVTFDFADDYDWAGWSTVVVAEKLGEESDYTTRVVVDGLKPATRYSYAAPFLNSSFVTAPEEGAGRFSFLSTSCIKARVPYNPLDNPLSINGFKVHDFLRNEVDFLLFLGDFTYADVPKLMGTDEESFRRHYRHVYWYLRALGWTTLPTVHVFDDHEIINDYDPRHQDLYAPAISSAWKAYQDAGNPAAMHDNTTYYTFERQGIPFFLMDTRTYRSLESAPDGPAKTMLGMRQLEDLRTWLEAHRAAPFKFVVSSVPFTKNWIGVDKFDTWGGYQHERRRILEWMFAAGGGVVVLSGDRHEAAAIRFPAPDGDSANDVYEFSASPFSQFYIPIRTHWQVDDEDVTLMYKPRGNSKVGKVDVEMRADGSTQMDYTLYIDGEAEWSYTLLR